jgi:hypothetical protein
MKYFIKAAYLLRDSQHFIDNVAKYYIGTGEVAVKMRGSIAKMRDKIVRSGSGSSHARAGELPANTKDFNRLRLSTIKSEGEFRDHVAGGMSRKKARKILNRKTAMKIYDEDKNRFVVTMRRSTDDILSGSKVNPRGFTFVSPQDVGRQMTNKKAEDITNTMNIYDKKNNATKAFHVPGSAAVDSQEHKDLLAAIMAR